jgi:ribosomal protein S18 acetylase RimI-like enzyme
MAAALEVVRLDDTRVPAAAAVLARAFFPDPLFAHVLPDEPHRAAALPALMQVVVTYCQRYGECYTTAGVVRAAAAWNAPGSEPSEERMTAAGFGTAAAAMGDAATGRMLAVVEHFEGLRARAVPDPHWYLMVVGVEPALQGQGVGGRLLQPVFARADAAGQSCYLETATSRDVQFYTRHGFEVVEEGTVPGAGAPYWTMRRPPATR